MLASYWIHMSGGLSSGRIVIGKNMEAHVGPSQVVDRCLYTFVEIHIKLGQPHSQATQHLRARVWLNAAVLPVGKALAAPAAWTGAFHSKAAWSISSEGRNCSVCYDRTSCRSNCSHTCTGSAAGALYGQIEYDAWDERFGYSIPIEDVAAGPDGRMW